MTNELVHYGVKGMRWGVRKQRVNKVLSENPNMSKKDIKKLKKYKRPIPVNYTISVGQQAVTMMLAKEVFKRLPNGQFVAANMNVASEKTVKSFIKNAAVTTAMDTYKSEALLRKYESNNI